MIDTHIKPAVEFLGLESLCHMFNYRFHFKPLTMARRCYVGEGEW